MLNHREIEKPDGIMNDLSLDWNLFSFDNNEREKMAGCVPTECKKRQNEKYCFSCRCRFYL